MLPLSYLPHCPNKPGRETEQMRMLFLNSHCYSVDFYANTNSLDYCRFLVSFEVRKCRSQAIICQKNFFLTVLDSLYFHMNFGNSLSISEMKKKSWNFGRVCMKL